MLPKHGDPLASKFFNDLEKLNGRPNRRKPLTEFKRNIKENINRLKKPK